MIGRDRRDGLAVVAHDIVGEHRLIAMFEAVERVAGDVFVRERAADARYCERRSDVETHDPRRRVR